MATAVYDVHQLRGTLTDVNNNQQIITQRLVDDVTHLSEAQATTNNILRTLDSGNEDVI